ncbi:DUF397 domain-containing protein [Nocardiopsis ganjiahuensis]|uniref:DUF397 domain-containing protein n=1 Tax=Nocardiopsis ganjiahuensis TaxID=239984 RepID=UPI00037D5339|nr:DUF397 domain-containing protein [Nocardiopsis ganjiahuensis]
MKSFEDPTTPPWHVSSFSSGQGNCVEVAEGHNVLVRDTKHRQHGLLSFTTQEWTHLLNTLQR